MKAGAIQTGKTGKHELIHIGDANAAGKARHSLEATRSDPRVSISLGRPA